MSRRRDSLMSPTLRNLIDDTAKGFYQFPDLQRDFVWDEEQRLNLCDSVNRGLPIGCLLVWRTRDDKVFKSRANIGALPLPTPPGRGESHYYVIDGLQRLTTLYSALARRTSEAESKLESGIGVLCFDLDAPTQKRRSPFCYLREPLPSSGRYIPLHFLFDATSLRKFQMRALKVGREDWLEESERLVNRFQSYEVPIIPLVTDERDVVAETFVRINSTGDKVEERDVLRALLWASDLGLESTFDEATVALEPLGWGQIEPDLMLSVLKATLGVEQYWKSPYALADLMKGNPSVLKGLPELLCDTVRILNGWGVRGPAALPYAYALVALARAIHRCGRVKVGRAVSRLERWFFQTAYGSYFAGITGDRLERAFDHVGDVVENENLDTRPDDLYTAVDPVARLTGGPRRSARTLLFATRMALESDRRREGSGDPGDESARLLGELGLKALHRLDARLPITDRASYVLCPAQRLGDLRDALQVQMPMFIRRSNTRLPHYLISEDAVARFRKGDLKGFLDLRRTELDELEQRFVEELGLHWTPSTPF